MSDAAATAETPPRVVRKRQRAPRIDIDATIAAAQQEMQAAARAMAAARRQARNEKRKKQRLVRKAAGLSSQDLERIAVLKRCGLWDPEEGTTFCFKKKGAEPAPEPSAALPAEGAPAPEASPASASAAPAEDEDMAASSSSAEE